MRTRHFKATEDRLTIHTELDVVECSQVTLKHSFLISSAMMSNAISSIIPQRNFQACVYKCFLATVARFGAIFCSSEEPLQLNQLLRGYLICDAPASTSETHLSYNSPDKVTLFMSISCENETTLSELSSSPMSLDMHIVNNLLEKLFTESFTWIAKRYPLYYQPDWISRLENDISWFPSIYQSIMNILLHPSKEQDPIALTARQLIKDLQEYSQSPKSGKAVQASLVHLELKMKCDKHIPSHKATYCGLSNASTSQEQESLDLDKDFFDENRSNNYEDLFNEMLEDSCSDIFQEDGREVCFNQDTAQMDEDLFEKLAETHTFRVVDFEEKARTENEFMGF